MKRILCLFISMIIILMTMPCSIMAQKSQTMVYIDNVLLDLEHPAEIKDGIPYIPLIETFFAMGVQMSYDEKENAYVGYGNNGEIEVVVGEDVIYVDWVNIKLPAEIYVSEDNTVMIPAYAVEDALKTETYVYDESKNIIYLVKPELEFNEAMEFNLANEVRKLGEGEQICDDEPLFRLQPDNGDKYIKMEEVDVSAEGMPFDRAIQIETLPLEGNQVPVSNYSIQKVVNNVGGDFDIGDVGIMTYWARATKITDETGSAGLRMCYERTEDYHKLSAQGDGSVTVGTEWKQYYEVLCNQRYAIPNNRSRLCIGVGYKPQIIQIAGLKIVNYKDTVDLETLMPNSGDTYKGMEEDALWRKEANKRIEEYRKNDMYINVVNEDGEPLENVNINVDMTKSEFIYGDTVMRREYMNLDPELESTRLQNEFYSEYLNTIIDSFIKWAVSYVNDGRDAIQVANYALSTLKKQIRAHCLMWDGVYPGEYKNIADMPYEEIYDIFTENTIKYMWAFKDKAVQWDVLNEPFDSNVIRNKYGNTLFADMMKLTKKIDPNTPLYVNETGMEGKNSKDEYTRDEGAANIIEAFLDEGAPIDGVGIQAHCTNLKYPQGFYWQIDTFARSVKNLAVTEFDLYTMADTEACKQYMEDIMRITYSHPKATGFLIWGHYDPNHWRADSNFYDKDYVAKYGHEVWQKLVLDEWWTRESGTTDSEGNFSVRGHRGDYDITVEYNGEKESIPFTLVQSDNDIVDNRIDIIIKNDGTINGTVTNTPKPLPTPIKFETLSEAYADFMARFGNDENPIYIADSYSDMGKQVLETYDGIENTYYESQNENHWVRYELSDQTYSGIISIEWKQDSNEAAHEYEVLVSDDGVEWESIYTGRSRKINTVGYESTKYLMIKYEGGNGFGISEVTVDALKEGTKSNE